MNALNLRQRQALAVGLLILVIFLVITLVIKPLLDRYLVSADKITALEQRIEVYERVAAGVDERKKRLQELRANNPVADLYLSETRPTLAAAQLQQQLNRIVGDIGGQVVSTQILPGSTATALPLVAIKAHVRGEIETLVNLLYQAESGRPLLFIDNLVVTFAARAKVRQPRGRAKRPLRKRATLPSLDIRFDLTGYTGKEDL